VTAWWNFEARLVLRETYQHFNIPKGDRVAIRFVIGLPPTSDPGTLRILKWEQERFKDIQMLNQSENMNEGKSFEYFADLARKYPFDDPSKRPYDYAMKADDDSLINIPQLLERLRPLTPRRELYMVLDRFMC
jgi:Galactosyltransferase